MKKLIVSLLAVAGMVACSNEDVVRQQAGEAIGFSGTFVENATRVDPSITTESIDAFRVWAFMDEVTGKVLNDEEVTKEGSFWFYKNVQYWMPGHTYYFAALAPAKGNWALNTKNEDGEYIANEHGAGIVDFTNVEGTEDLLYAATVRENSVLNGNAPVQFQFNHLLSKIKFTFENGFTTENVDVEVKNVTMTAPKSGSIDLAVENWLDNSDWVDLTDGLTLEFGDVVRLNHGQSASAADERLTIPASAEREYVVNFDVVVYSGEVATEFPKTATITGIPFEMGKAYNLKATIDHKTLNLEEIVFEVEKVKEWDYVDDYEFGFTDREESEEPVEPETPAVPEGAVKLESKSAGEVIGSYYYGWTLKDTEGNNSVKLVIDQTALVQATDFPKAHDYTAFQSSPSWIQNGSQFSFVNKSLKVNGVTYANADVSNAKLTVVEATSITIEFTVGGEDYKFFYSI